MMLPCIVTPYLPKSTSFQDDATTSFLSHRLFWFIKISLPFLTITRISLSRIPWDSFILLSLPTTFITEQHNKKRTQPILNISTSYVISCWYFMSLISQKRGGNITITCIQFLVPILDVPVPSSCVFGSSPFTINFRETDNSYFEAQTQQRENISKLITITSLFPAYNFV